MGLFEMCGSKGLTMYEETLNRAIYRTITEQHIFEWIQDCLNSPNIDNTSVVIPGYIVDSIKSLSTSIAEFVCIERAKQQKETTDDK